MYYPYFITYLLIGFFISVTVFIWAVKNEQFSDQQRARFLPLEKETDPDIGAASKVGRYEMYALFFLAFAGLGASAAVLIYALFF